MILKEVDEKFLEVKGFLKIIVLELDGEDLYLFFRVFFFGL